MVSAAALVLLVDLIVDSWAQLCLSCVTIYYSSALEMHHVVGWIPFPPSTVVGGEKSDSLLLLMFYNTHSELFRVVWVRNMVLVPNGAIYSRPLYRIITKVTNTK